MQSTQKSDVSLDEQLKLARALLLHYETWHPLMEFQLTNYTVACCDIALPGEVKFDVGSKTIIFDIKTEKRYKFKDQKLIPIKTSKVSNFKYKAQKRIAIMNLQSWTKELLWGDSTTVRVYIDGTEQQSDVDQLDTERARSNKRNRRKRS